MDRLLSTREVAELIGNMSPRFVQREAASGRLRCQAIGAGGARRSGFSPPMWNSGGLVTPENAHRRRIPAEPI